MLATVILPIFLVLSVFTFFEYRADKQAAIKGRWRKRESYMLWLSGLGGAFGGLLAMFAYRHKTRKVIFWLVNVSGVAVYSWVILWLISLG